MPVGFKWFVDGLLDGSLGFGGEESAGASFLRRDGSVWTTDKDGIIPACSRPRSRRALGRDPGEVYRELTREFGEPAVRAHRRAGHARRRRRRWQNSRREHVRATELAGEKIVAMLTTRARQRQADRRPQGRSPRTAGSPRGPPGTEDIYKIYAESFRGEEHLRRIQAEAQAIVAQAIAGARSISASSA